VGGREREHCSKVAAAVRPEVWVMRGGWLVELNGCSIASSRRSPEADRPCSGGQLFLPPARNRSGRVNDSGKVSASWLSRHPRWPKSLYCESVTDVDRPPIEAPCANYDLDSCLLTWLSIILSYRLREQLFAHSLRAVPSISASRAANRCCRSMTPVTLLRQTNGPSRVN